MGELRRLARAVVASVAACALASALAGPAFATSSVTVTPSPSSVQPSSTATITAGMPVSDAGTVSQEITQTIDPTKAVLTGAADILKPVGWSLQYFNGSSWSGTAPASAGAWAQISKVRTSGTISSQGSDSGYQIATGTATGAAVNLTPATIPASGGGDGYQAFFDPARTRVFNVYHHNTTTSQLDCHVLATGATCTGFPFAVGIARTSQYSTGRVVGTKIWIPAYKQGASTSLDSVGFYCVNIATVLASGGSPSMCGTAYVPLAMGTDVNVGTAFARASSPGLYEFRSIDGVSTAGSGGETRIWASLASNGKVVCLDTATGAACAGMPANGWSTAVKGWKLDSNSTGGDFTSMTVSGGRIYVEGSSSTTNNAPVGNLTIACVLVSDPSTECPGFTGGKNLGANWAIRGSAMVGNLVELPAADGSTAGVCLLGDTRTLAYGNLNQTLPASSPTAVPCWDAAGTAFTGPATLSTMVTSAFSYGFVEYQQPLRVGSRIYWGNGVNFTSGGADYPPRVFCWDASKASGAGGPCANLAATGYATDNYTVTPDPAIPDCMWVTRDTQPNLRTYNMVGNVAGCSTIAPTRASFPGGTVVPRMACSSNPGAVRAWRSFTLTSPAPSATFTAVLTVKDSSGNPISGWQNLTLTPGTPLNLATLLPSATGVSPTFDVDFTISSGSVTSATAQVQAVGDAPELCLTVTTAVNCPAASLGPIPTPANSATMALLGEGNATDAQSQTTTFTPGTSTLAISAPSVAQCSGTLNGRATDTSASPQPIAGTTVALYDGSGNPVVYPIGNPQAGQPVTTTTDASGNYTFSGIAPGSYKTRFVNTSPATVVSSTVAAGGSGTVNAASGAVLSNASTVAAGGTGTINALYSLPPTAPSRTSTTVQGALVVFDPFAVSGGSSAATPSSGSNFTATKGSTRLCGPSDTAPNCTQTSVTSAQGTWTVSTSGATAGQITFTPAAGYSGTAPAMTYSVTDAAGQKATATLTPTVVPPPTATPDTSTGVFNAIQTIQPQTNDIPGAGTTLVATSTTICASGTAAASCTGTSLNNANGTYTVDPATGYVSFKPCSANGVAGVAPNNVANVSCTGPFTGTATAIGYRVTDALGQFATSTITPTVQAPAVDTANPDTTTGAKGVAQTINLLANDTAPAGVSLTASTVKLCGISPAQTPPSCTQTSITVANVGTYAVASGTMTFTPVAAYTGTPSPLTYQVTDNINRTVSSTYTPTVAGPPTVTPDTSTGSWDANQTISPLANDTAGAGTTLTASSVKLCANGTAAGSCTGTTYTVTGQGTYTANADGTVTFDPLPGFSGTATPIQYRVTDALGQTSVSTITPTVSPPPAPIATPETKTVIPGGSVAFTTLTGGSGLASGTQLQTGSTFLCGVSPAQSPPNCTQTTVTISGQGTYTLVQGTGIVTYTALGGATTGTKTPITYQVADVTGQKTSSTLTPVIPPTPTATADTSVGGAGQPQTISPLSNDAAGSGTTLNATSTKLCAAGTAAASCTGTTLANADGTYTVDPATGYVLFQPCTAAATPNANCTGAFSGTATAIGYRVSDALGQFATSTITPTVLPQPATSATNDAGTSNYAQPVVFNTLANDSAGDMTLAAASYTTLGSATLDPATVKLCGTGQAVPSCTATTLATSSGTYTVNPVDGKITFQPCTAAATPNAQCAAAFTGTPASPPTYQVCNAIAGTWAPTPVPVSTCASASVIPTINPPAALVAVADTSSGPWNTPQTITVLTTDVGNAGSHADTTDPAATIPASSVKLCATGQVSPGCSATTVMVAGEGTYVVNGNGTVTFTPLAAFHGTATALAYQITDSLGRSASTTITPTVAYPTAPTASPDSMLALPGVPKAFTTITGASGLATGTQLQTSGPTQTCLIDPATPSSCSSSVTTADGTWSLNPATGVATYTADPSATPGAKTAVSYRVTDVTGQTATAALTPTVPGTPTATPDTSTGAWNTAQTKVLTTNDTAGSGTTLAVASTRLCDPNATPPEAAPNCTATNVTIAGQGTYVLTGGSVVFTPLSSFFGAATPVGYQIANSAGLVASSTYTPTVQPPTSPSASPDTSTGPWNTPQTIRPLVNDTVATGLTLSSSATYLCGPTETPPSCTQTSLAVTGQGTYTVNGDGSVTFTPDATFLGTATSVVYQTADSVGQVTYSTIAVTVTPTPPTITNATVTVAAGGSGTMTPTTTSGSSPINPTLTCLKPSGGSACAAGDLAVTATEGTYVLNPSTGVVTFTAAPGYAGTPANPPSMCVTDTAAVTACGTLTPTVQPAATPRTDPAPPSNPNAPVGSSPIAQPDYATTQVGVPVTVALFGNDAPSIAQQLVPASVRLQDPTSGAWTTTVTVAGEGSYSVDLTAGTVTFTPIAGFTGRAQPVPYRVADTSGKVTQSTVEITVTTLPPPYANPDYSAGAQGQPLYFNLFANDQATGTTFDPSSVVLRDPKTGKWSQTVIMPGQGTYSVNPTTGVVTFMPLPSFTGTATPIDYRASTRTGTLIRSSLHPTIIGPEAKLRITTTPSKTTLRTSGSTVVRLRACNTGRATAVDTVVELPIPAGMAVPNLRQSPNGPKLRNGVVRWSTGSLKPGACVSRTVTLTVLKSGPKRLVGTVRAVNATQATDPATVRGVADGTRPAVVTG